MTTYTITDAYGVTLWHGTDKAIANLKLAYAQTRSPHLGYRLITERSN